MEKVRLATMNTYISVGQKSYREHYLHLWKYEDPSPYISQNFTTSVVQRELSDPNCLHYLVKLEKVTVGIVKLVRDCALDELSPSEALNAEKIYLLKDFSGQGLGKKYWNGLKTSHMVFTKKWSGWIPCKRVIPFSFTKKMAI